MATYDLALDLHKVRGGRTPGYVDARVGDVRTQTVRALIRMDGEDYDPPSGSVPRLEIRIPGTGEWAKAEAAWDGSVAVATLPDNALAVEGDCPLAYFAIELEGGGRESTEGFALRVLPNVGDVSEDEAAAYVDRLAALEARLASFEGDAAAALDALASDAADELAAADEAFAAKAVSLDEAAEGAEALRAQAFNEAEAARGRAFADAEASRAADHAEGERAREDAFADAQSARADAWGAFLSGAAGAEDARAGAFADAQSARAQAFADAQDAREDAWGAFTAGAEAAEAARAQAYDDWLGGVAAQEAAEAARAEAERARAWAEAERAAAEAGRASAESARGTEFGSWRDEVGGWGDAASQAAQAELDRQAAESARASAEASRASAESARASAESARVTAEADRAAAFAQMQDAAAGGSVVVLASGEYDPETAEPTLTSGAAGVLYLAPDPEATSDNAYVEWFWHSGRFERYGRTSYRVEEASAGQVARAMDGEAVSGSGVITLTTLAQARAHVYADIGSLSSDVSGLGGDLSGLASDHAALASEVSGLAGEVAARVRDADLVELTAERVSAAIRAVDAARQEGGA